MYVDKRPAGIQAVQTLSCSEKGGKDSETPKVSKRISHDDWSSSIGSPPNRSSISSTKRNRLLAAGFMIAAKAASPIGTPPPFRSTSYRLLKEVRSLSEPLQIVQSEWDSFTPFCVHTLVLRLP